MKKFTIDRTKWLRGEGSDASQLHRASDCKECCFEQIAVQCGVPTNSLAGLAELDHVARGTPFRQNIEAFLKEARMLGCWEKSWVREAYEINDRSDMSDADRESQLIALFRENGMELEFLG